MKGDRRRFGCSDVKAMLGTPLRCCTSCHVDANKGDGGVVEYESPDGSMVLDVCCTVAAGAVGTVVPWLRLARARKRREARPCPACRGTRRIELAGEAGPFRIANGSRASLTWTACPHCRTPAEDEGKERRDRE